MVDVKPPSSLKDGSQLPNDIAEKIIERINGCEEHADDMDYYVSNVLRNYVPDGEERIKYNP